jgi:hypothetical protein
MRQYSYEVGCIDCEYHDGDPSIHGARTLRNEHIEETRHVVRMTSANGDIGAMSEFYGPEGRVPPSEARTDDGLPPLLLEPEVQNGEN